MKIRRMDHVGVNVEDLAAAKAFFVELGLEVMGEWEAEGEWLDKIVGLKGAKTACVMLRAPDGGTNIELVEYKAPLDERGIQPSCANTLGIRHLTFAVEDLEGIIAKVKKKGAEPFSEIQSCGGYRMCYVHGPEGIILELAEETK